MTKTDEDSPYKKYLIGVILFSVLVILGLASVINSLNDEITFVEDNYRNQINETRELHKTIIAEINENHEIQIRNMEENYRISCGGYTNPNTVANTPSSVGVGIRRLEGIPQIIQCIQDFTPSRHVSFIVKNIGENSGFTADIICSSGKTGFVSGFDLDSGETEIIIAELISSPQQSTSSSTSNCRLIVRDIGGGNTDECNFVL